LNKPKNEMNRRLQHLTFVFIVLIIVIVNSLRFFKLAGVPMGYHVDESSSSLTVECLGTEGIDSLGVRYPFFSDFGYGTPKPFLYMYPAVVWTKVFGYSIPSFRAYTAAWMIVGSSAFSCLPADSGVSLMPCGLCWPHPFPPGPGAFRVSP